MKRFHLFSTLVSSLLGWLVAGCHAGDSMVTTLQSDCRLQQIVTTTSALGTTENTQTVYDYDAAGNLLKTKLTSTATYSVGGGQNTTTTETYTYSTDNFLTNYTYATESRQTFAGKTSTYQYAQNKAYTYLDQRLTGYTLATITPNPNAANGPSSLTTTTSVVYDYDAAGQLIKETLSTPPSQMIATWTYQNGQAVAYVERSGTSESRPLTLQNGLVIKSRYSGTQSFDNATTRPYIVDQLYQYDDQRRLIKQQQVTNDTLDTYFTQAWQTGTRATLAVPGLKGHPVRQSPYGETGVMTKKSVFNVNKQQANTIYPYLEYTYTNQLNAQGLVTNTQVSTQQYTNGQTQPDLTTLVYTYSGCK